MMKRYIQASLTEGLVGLWWYYPDNSSIIACKCEIDEGCTDGDGQIQYMDNKNHLTEWSSIIKEQLPDRAEDIISKGFKSLERGRVIYNPLNHTYTIVCSEQVSKDGKIISKIVSEFSLYGCKYEVEVAHHYHLAPLTGNAALDNFEYNF